MIEIDLRGLSCPIPVVKTKKAMEKYPDQAIQVLLESQVSKENVTRLAVNNGYKVKENEAEREYKLYLEPENK